MAHAASRLYPQIYIYRQEELQVIYRMTERPAVTITILQMRETIQSPAINNHLAMYIKMERKATLWSQVKVVRVKLHEFAEQLITRVIVPNVYFALRVGNPDDV